MERLFDALPINWRLIGNPLNWAIVLLMVIIAGFAFDAGARFITTHSEKEA